MTKPQRMCFACRFMCCPAECEPSEHACTRLEDGTTVTRALCACGLWRAAGEDCFVCALAREDHGKETRP